MDSIDMSDVRRVKDYPSLVKDEETRAVMTTDSAELAAYKRRKQQTRDVEYMKEKQERMENDLIEIKSLLRSAIEEFQNK